MSHFMVVGDAVFPVKADDHRELAATIDSALSQGQKEFLGKGNLFWGHILVFKLPHEQPEDLAEYTVTTYPELRHIAFDVLGIVLILILVLVLSPINTKSGQQHGLAIVKFRIENAWLNLNDLHCRCPPWVMI
jgi:hypothetical protein